MKLLKLSSKYLLAVVAIFLLAAGCTKTNTNTPNVNVNTNATTKQNNTSFSYQGEEGKSALEILKAKYKTETKTYSGMGEFVQSINGIAPDSKHFWAFYVNGVSSNVGASEYKTKNTDNIEWRLEEIKQ